MSFIEDADQWRAEAWKIIRRTPHLQYQLLTKRPQNIPGRLPADWPLPNVWLGISAEDQIRNDERVQLLIKHGSRASVKFVSIGPMIGQIIGHSLADLSWVICEGESGPDAPYMEPEWALSLKNQCLAASVPFFMKQMSGKKPIPDYLVCREYPLKTK